MDYTENTLDTLPQIDAENAKELADAIAEVLDSKKGRDIKVLHVEDKTVIAEYFVICTGNSSTQIKALAGEVEYRIGLRGVEAYSVEGRDNNQFQNGGTIASKEVLTICVSLFVKDAGFNANADIELNLSFQGNNLGRQ